MKTRIKMRNRNEMRAAKEKVTRIQIRKQIRKRTRSKKENENENNNETEKMIKIETNGKTIEKIPRK